MKILLGDFNAKVGKEDIFKLTIGNESLHEISTDNGVRLVNFATSKNIGVKSTMFPHRNIHKYTWTSPDGKTHSKIDRFNMHNVSDVRQIEVHMAESLVPGPSRLEVEIAVTKFKEYKSSGSDQIPAELIQA
jgi:hypothetical protein